MFHSGIPTFIGFGNVSKPFSGYTKERLKLESKEIYLVPWNQYFAWELDGYEGQFSWREVSRIFANYALAKDDTGYYYFPDSHVIHKYKPFPEHKFEWVNLSNRYETVAEEVQVAPVEIPVSVL
jgi:hypothetical protein